MAHNIIKLRKQFNVGVMHAKIAYEKANGNYEIASSILREEGLKIAEKRTAKLTKYSTIGYYIHTNQRVGAMVELWCETDIMASSDFFNQFANELAMHVSAKAPKYISKNDVSKDVLMNLDEEKDFLLDQKYLKDEEKTIRELIMTFIYNHKENIEVRKFVCFHALRQL